ncbi:hypothetical protein K0U07_01695 [bacterium]|nr:hypothetical protein [bacterium]
MKIFSFFFLCCVSLFSFQSSLQVRGGYFFPQEERLRDIYHGGGWEPEIEARFCFYEKFDAWVNFNAFWRSGRSSLGRPTFIQIYPLSIGVNYNIEIIDHFDFYLGVGPVITWLIISDNSPYVKRSIFQTGGGVTSKTGITYHLPKWVFLDFYADYSYMYIGSFHQDGVETNSLNVGGLRLGLGLGGTF